jgi:hypothetical protein
MLHHCSIFAKSKEDCLPPRLQSDSLARAKSGQKAALDSCLGCGRGTVAGFCAALAREQGVSFPSEGRGYKFDEHHITKAIGTPSPAITSYSFSFQAEVHHAL